MAARCYFGAVNTNQQKDVDQAELAQTTAASESLYRLCVMHYVNAGFHGTKYIFCKVVTFLYTSKR